MNLTEATIKALQGELDNEINYDEIQVIMNVNKSSLDGTHIFKNKQDLEQYLLNEFKPNVVKLLMTFDNNSYTDIIEPRNDDKCKRSCEFEFPDMRYPNRKLYIKIIGYYRRPAPEPDEPLTQQEAIEKITSELEIIYSIDRYPNGVIIKGDIGGDTITYQIDNDGHIGVK